MAGSVGWHPGRFRSEAAFASFAGVAPTPADQDLGGGGRSDAEEVQKLGSQLSDEAEYLTFEVLGLSLQGLDALGSGSHGSDCHPMLHVLRRPVPELRAAGDLSRALELPQFGTEVVWAGHDQRFQLVDRGAGGKDCPVSSGEQDAQGLRVPRRVGAGSGAQ